MKKITFIALFYSFLWMSCSRDEWNYGPENTVPKIVFQLQADNYEGEAVRQSSSVSYDRLFHCIVDEDGERVRNVKSFYNTSTGEIYAEGLHAGEYRLLVLGIRGDETKDRAVIHELNHINEEWLSFPVDLRKPLDAEYFYSQTPFSVSVQSTPDGNEEIVAIREIVRQQRLIGRMMFGLSFQNPYVRNSVVSKTVSLENASFYTRVTGDGHFVGESEELSLTLDLAQESSVCFMPLVAGQTLSGNISLRTQDYSGQETEQFYSFTQSVIEPNHSYQLETSVTHPDDRSVVMYLPKQAYREGNYPKILQDDEPKEVYTDPAQRKFSTADPLQLWFSDDGRLQARFYSPRVLTDVLVRVRIPTVSDEYFDLAYFDSIPAFADFSEEVPLVQRATMCQTESGRLLEVDKISVSGLDGAEFKILSEDPYWHKLQGIVHGWNIYWGLYGGNPELPDGGPVGNWMGIRPVHCRESVALFLNFTYMLDMPEHEVILRENANKLYDDNGQLVEVEEVLRKMRQERDLKVGLVYPGNGVLGLGGGIAFGAYQQAWFQHYSNTYSCNIMFHELGHVMGYGHSSSFTYGPWAEELMNHFYVNNIKELPIDSPTYLNSESNPNKY